MLDILDDVAMKRTEYAIEALRTEMLNLLMSDNPATMVQRRAMARIHLKDLQNILNDHEHTQMFPKDRSYV